MGKRRKIDYTKRLMDDVWFEIFLRLPLESIYKYRCVSKLWLSLLSNTYFLNSYWRIHKSLTPCMVIYNLDCSVKERVSILLTKSIHSKFVSDHEGLSFKFLSKRCPVNEPNTYLLASSNGLVLCSNRLTYQLTYLVCNPLTRKWVFLRRRPIFYYKWGLNGFLCEPSTSLVPPILMENRRKNNKKPSTSSTTSFMLVRIPGITEPSRYFNIEIYYSELGRWVFTSVSCPDEVTFLPYSSNRIVSCNKVFYWIEGGNRVIAYDLNWEINPNRCRLISLPEEINNKNRCLGESGGFIYYCHFQREQLSLWVLDQEDYLFNKGWNWRLVHKIDAEDMLIECDDGKLLSYGSQFMKPLAMSPVDPDVVILRAGGLYLYFYSYNIRTRRLVLLRSPESDSYDDYGTHDSLPFVLTPRPTTV